MQLYLQLDQQGTSSYINTLSSSYANTSSYSNTSTHAVSASYSETSSVLYNDNVSIGDDGVIVTKNIGLVMAGGANYPEDPNGGQLYNDGTNVVLYAPLNNMVFLTGGSNHVVYSTNNAWFAVNNVSIATPSNTTNYTLDVNGTIGNSNGDMVFASSTNNFQINGNVLCNSITSSLNGTASNASTSSYLQLFNETTQTWYKITISGSLGNEVLKFTAI